MTALSPAETLTAAAQLLRERATAATPGPWHATVSGLYDEDTYVVSPFRPVASAEEPARTGGQQDVAYIALMHPGVGLALADWLDSLTGIEFSEHGPMPDEFKHALAAARQLLGEAS